MKFPMLKPPYPPLELYDDAVECLQRSTGAGVAALVFDYENFVKHCNGDIVKDLRHNWKFVKQRRNLTVYQDRTPNIPFLEAAPVSPTPSFLCIGSIDGTLNDIMSAVVSQTVDDAILKSAVLGDNVVDCSVLAPIVAPSPHDPFCSLTLKWAVNAGPKVFRPFVRARDFTYVESTGVTTNFDDERLGYHVIHSIDFPSHGEHKLIRGTISLYHVYRQKTPTTVEVHARAFWDLHGRLHPMINKYWCVNATIAIHRLPFWSQVKRLARLQQNRSDEIDQVTPKCCNLCKHRIGGWFTPANSCLVCRCAVCWWCSITTRAAEISSINRKVLKKTRTICRRCARESEATAALATTKRKRFAKLLGHRVLSNASLMSMETNSTNSTNSARSR